EADLAWAELGELCGCRPRLRAEGCGARHGQGLARHVEGQRGAATGADDAVVSDLRRHRHLRTRQFGMVAADRAEHRAGFSRHRRLLRRQTELAAAGEGHGRVRRLGGERRQGMELEEIVSTTQTLSGYTIAFDLDGTLVDSAPDLATALNKVLAKEGL